MHNVSNPTYSLNSDPHLVGRIKSKFAKTASTSTTNSNINDCEINGEYCYITTNSKEIDYANSSLANIYNSNQNELYSTVNKFKNKPQQQQLIQQQNSIRSKTPGPDVIYFRDEPNIAVEKETSKPIHFNQSKNKILASTASSNTSMSNQFSSLGRSKTPTAEMMYYPTPNNNNDTKTNKKNMPFHKSQTDHFNQSSFSSHLQTDNEKLLDEVGEVYCDADGNYYIEMVVTLARQDSGFGFKIIGGEEESSQVAIGYIVFGGAAHLDNRLRINDEILMIDDECVLGATHKRAVQLMTIAGLNQKVKLMIRRKLRNQKFDLISKQRLGLAKQKHNYPYKITLFRNIDEEFGFILVSSLNKSNQLISKILENSPAERCQVLNIGDRILALNDINITHMSNFEIFKLIKESGNSITLTVEPNPGRNLISISIMFIVFYFDS